MNEQEALTRIKTGNFNNGCGFDMQLLVDAVGIIGEMLKSEQIREVVQCKDCKLWKNGLCESDDVARKINDCGCYPDFRTDSDWFCADGEKDGGQMKRPKETFWDSLSEADLMEPMHHFED